MPLSHVLVLAAALQAPAAGAAYPLRSLAGAPPTAAEAAPSANDKRICRRTVPTGSRLGGVSECLTAAQWREREAASAQILRDVQTRSLQLRPQ